MPVAVMTQIDLPEYTEINRILSKTTLKLNPSQAHGLICGLLCGNPHSSQVWEEAVTGDKKSSKARTDLKKLYNASATQLDEFLFEFQLLLPEDSNELPERAEALTLWTQGFLTGLKLSQIDIVDRESGEVTEAINDMIEIAKMNYEDVVVSDDDEAAYIELVEYVRMAVILIYQDLHESDTGNKATGSNKHLH
jgi:hypothetical protein